MRVLQAFGNFHFIQGLFSLLVRHICHVNLLECIRFSIFLAVLQSHSNEIIFHNLGFEMIAFQDVSLLVFLTPRLNHKKISRSNYLNN